MAILSVILGINLYVLFVAFFHKMFEDRHGHAKAFIFSNLVILATIGLFFLLFY